MKKQFGLPLMLASALAFSACSSDDVAEKGSKDISALTNGGYLKMSINLPSRAANGGLRAAEQDGHVSLEDGLAKEYNVKDATLILFQGNDEASARFHSAYILTNNFTASPGGNQVSSTKQLVKSVKGDVVGDNLYALVVLNKNNVIQPQADHTLLVNGQDFFGNFEQLQKTVVKNQDVTAKGVAAFITDDDYFFMTNAPLATVQGGTSKPSDAKIKTLVKINQNIYSTEKDAKDNPAADIYVERGVAKVTMHTVDPGKLEDEAYKGGMNTVSYTVDAWGLDITNKSSYFARVPNTGWNSYTSQHLGTGVVDYRFIGSKGIASTGGSATPGTAAPAVNWYRTYWGQDPNYASADASNDFERLVNKSTLSAVVDYKLNGSFGDNAPLYCLENTFDVDNMKQDRSTRVVVRAQLSTAGITAGQDFYTVNGGKTTLYSKANLDKMVQKAIYDHADVQRFITNNGGTFSSDKIVLTYSTRADATGEQTIENFDVTIGSTPMTSSEKATALHDVNNQIKHITCYKEGYAYYPIIIKHFGNDQTPWGLDKDNAITGTNIYPTTNRDDNYLGRYGVLRNNWYDLEVTGIRTIGSAVIPSPNDKYDDELNQFISVKINVLSWAKHKQSEKL